MQVTEMCMKKNLKMLFWSHRHHHNRLINQVKVATIIVHHRMMTMIMMMIQMIYLALLNFQMISNEENNQNFGNKSYNIKKCICKGSNISYNEFCLIFFQANY